MRLGIEDRRFGFRTYTHTTPRHFNVCLPSQHSNGRPIGAIACGSAVERSIIQGTLQRFKEAALLPGVTLYFLSDVILDPIIVVEIDSCSSLTTYPERGTQEVSLSIFNVQIRLFCVLLIGLIATQNAQAQDASKNSSGISVAVSQQVKITANKLRLMLPIRVETRDEASVLKTMKKHQEAVRKELKTFGVDDSAIEFSSPLVTAGIPGVEDPDASRKAARSQIIQMRNMNPTMRGQFPLPNLDDEDDSELPVVYAADATLVVDWNLEKESEEAASLLPSKVKRLYEQKDLTGKKLRAELTEEEQSLVEPLLGNGSSYISYQVQSSPSNQLYYVGELLPEQEKAAFAEAMKKARAQAELIAQSSGLRLGKIRSIQTSTGSDPTFEQMSVLSAVRSESSVSTLRQKNEREVLGTRDGLTKRIQLVVVFDFE